MTELQYKGETSTLKITKVFESGWILRNNISSEVTIVVANPVLMTNMIKRLIIWFVFSNAEFSFFSNQIIATTKVVSKNMLIECTVYVIQAMVNIFGGPNKYPIMHSVSVRPSEVVVSGTQIMGTIHGLFPNFQMRYMKNICALIVIQPWKIVPANISLISRLAMPGFPKLFTAALKMATQYTNT